MSAKELEELMNELQEVENQLKDLKARWPAHSLKPVMLSQLEDLEEERDRLKLLVNELTINCFQRDSKKLPIQG